jgi:hypothetical protein
MAVTPNTYLTSEIAQILEDERYHCVDCIDWQAEGDDPSTTPEEWVQRTAMKIAQRIEEDFTLL